MRHLLACQLLCLLFAWTVSTGEGAAPKSFEVGPPASWVNIADVPTAGSPKEHASGLDFLLLDQQVRIASGDTYLRRTYQIVSDSGRQNNAQVSLSFDPSYQTLKVHHLKLLRGAETIDKLDVSRFQILQQERDLDRQLYNGTLSAFIILEDVRIGDVIDVAYTLHGRNPVFGDHFIDTSGLGWAVPVRDFRYRLVIPAERNLQTRIHGSATPQVSARELDTGEKEMLWKNSHLPTIHPENSVPADYVLYPFLDVSDFATWKDVVDWARPLYGNDESATPLIDALVATLRESGSTQEALALAALTFVQKEIRYLGMEMGAGSHRPSPPEEVLRRRFGDCKDKARLLATLMTRLHLRAAPALVHSSSGNLVAERLPSPYAFDHVVVAVTVQGKHFLLDPTLSYQRGDTLPKRHVGTYRTYLRIAAGVSQLERAIYGPFDMSRIRVDETFVLTDVQQPANLKVVTRYEGKSAQSMRAYFAQTAREQIERNSLDYYHQYYPGITSAGAVDMQDDESLDRVTVTESYAVKELFSTTGKGTVLQAYIQPGTIWSWCRVPSLDQRQHPFSLAAQPVYVTQQITLQLPSDWPVTPNRTTVKDPAFELTVEVSHPASRTVLLNHSWHSTNGYVPVERLGAFADKLREAQGHLGYVLTYNPALAEGAPYRLNWPMIGLALLLVAGGVYVMVRFVGRRNSAPPPLPASSSFDYLEPGRNNLEGLGGWLVLVAINLIVAPFFTASSILSGHRAYFNQDVWEALTTPGATGYIPHFSLVASVELSLYLLDLLYNIFVLILFFRRSHLFPFQMQVFIFFRLATAFVMLWSNSLIAVDAADAVSPESIRVIVQTVIAACVWIPYFRISRRVKQTFVR